MAPEQAGSASTAPSTPPLIGTRPPAQAGSRDAPAADPSYGASGHYDARYFAWQNANIDIKTRFKVKRFVRHVRPTDTVIDFGCAGGALVAALPGARRIGVEINDVARESAVREYGIEAYRDVA